MLGYSSKRIILIPMNTMVYEGVISGADIFVIELAKRISKNFDIWVMTNDIGKNFWTKNVNNIKRILMINSLLKTSSPLLIAFVLALRALLAIFTAIKIRKYTFGSLVIYTPSDYICDIAPAIYLKLFRNSKNISWIARIHHVILPPQKRTGNFFYNLISFVEQRICIWLIKRYADMTLTLSGTYDELLALGFDKEKLTILDPGVDLELIHSVPTSPNKLYDAVTVGRLHPSKGTFDLIKIWKQVVKHKPDARLAIIGGGSRKIFEKVRDLIKKYGLENNIELLGFIKDRRELYRIMKSSKLYIDAEHEDGWSMSGSEGMACGLPLLAWDSLKMFKYAYRRGFKLAPFHNYKSFASIIVELLSDERKRERLSSEALEESKNFGWDIRARELESLLSRI